MLVITKLSGFVKEMLVAQFYGASSITDAYNVVVSMCSILFEGFTVSICTSYISVVSKERDDQEKVWRTTSNVMLLLWSIVFVLSILAAFFARPVCAIFAVGFDKATMDMTVAMARIVLPIASLFVIKGVLGGYLQVNGSFWYTGIGTCVMNIILIVSVCISKGSIYILAGGYTLAAVGVTVLGIVNAKMRHFQFVPKLKLQDETIKLIVRLSLPIFISQSITDLNLLIDRNFASVLGTGMISMFNYANKLNVLFIAIFAQAFATVIFPEFASLAANRDDKGKFYSLMRNALEITAYIMIPVAVFIGITSKEIVDLAFYRGAFTKSNVLTTGNILQIYAITLPFMSLTEIYTKGYYAIEDTKRPMFFSLVSLLTNIVLNFVLINIAGYRGLAFSTLLSVALQLILLSEIFEKGHKVGYVKHICIFSLKCICATIPFLVVFFINAKIYSLDWMYLYKVLLVGIEFIVLGILYLITTNALGINFMYKIKETLDKKLHIGGKGK